MEPFPPPAADSPRCPHWAILADFNSGRLSEPELEAVADHVSTCQRCETVLRRLKSETGNAAIAGRLRDCLARPADENPPGYQALMAAAKALAGPDPSRDEHARPPGLPATAPTAEAGSAADTRIANFVGRYLVMESIGHGGMGVVYRAIQQSMNRTVALKTIRAADGAKPEAIARFRQEAAAVSRLEHPNVVRVYDFDEQDGVPYFVMELMGGGHVGREDRQRVTRPGGGRDRPGGRRRRGVRPRSEGHPPGLEAGQRLVSGGRDAEGRRLRAG